MVKKCLAAGIFFFSPIPSLRQVISKCENCFDIFIQDMLAWQGMHNLSTGGRASGWGTDGPTVGWHVPSAVGLFAAPCQLGCSENVVGSQLAG